MLVAEPDTIDTTNRAKYLAEDTIDTQSRVNTENIKIIKNKII
jgi:hypothetical protein